MNLSLIEVVVEEKKSFTSQEMSKNWTATDVVTANGVVQVPIHLNPIIMITHLVCCFIGIPLNGFIAGTIMHQRRLRRKPRNIFLLGIILSSLFAFVPVLLELVYFHFPSISLCRSYVAIVGLPYVTTLTNVFLALIDRYVAISYPLWHRKKITVRRVILWQITSTFTVSVAYKFFYVVQILPLECEVKFLQVKSIALSLLMLLFLCVGSHIVVYNKTKEMIHQASLRGIDLTQKQVPLSVAFSKQARTRVQQVAEESASDQTEVAMQQLEENSASATNVTSLNMSIHVGRNCLGSLEIEATRTLISGVLSLFVMTGPFISFTFVMFICRMHSLDCQNIGWLAPYFKELVVLHAIYHPIFYLARNTEFNAALRGTARY